MTVLNGRHWFSINPLTIPPNLFTYTQIAIQFEEIGNWHRAGETYLKIIRENDLILHHAEKSQLFARSGSCFQIAGEPHLSAQCYQEAAISVSEQNVNPQLSGELFNRASFQFRMSLDFFLAGVAAIRAAEEFDKISAHSITCSEITPPLPQAALKSHLCGLCFESAARSFENAYGEEMWAVTAFWRAGEAYAKGPPSIQSFEAYHRALIATVKYYGTLDDASIRSVLPLSEEQRINKADPIFIMEQALVRCNDNQQSPYGSRNFSRQKTHTDMAIAFRKISSAFQKVGNIAEAAVFRARYKEQQRRSFIANKRYFLAIIFYIWKISSNYGQSLIRWAASCIFLIMTFSAAYRFFQCIEPTTNNRSVNNLNFFDDIFFSVVTFSTLGYGDLHPAGIIGQMLSLSEVTIGFLMFGVLLTFIGSKLNIE